MAAAAAAGTAATLNGLVSGLLASIAALPDRAAVNGNAIYNSATPSTAHVPEFMKWPRLAMSGTGAGSMPADFETHVCRLGNFDAPVPTAGQCDIQSAVYIAAARMTAERVLGVTDTTLNANEVAIVTPLSVDAAHHAAMVKAMEDVAEAATRGWTVAAYVAVSFATCGHHHLPAVTKKLFTTTSRLLGVDDMRAATPGFEGWLFHDAFHPLTFAFKGELARMLSIRGPLDGYGMSNLAKRIPVKAPDTAIAMNYSALYEKCTQFPKEDGATDRAAAEEANLDATDEYNDRRTKAEAKWRRDDATDRAAGGPGLPAFSYPALRVKKLPAILDPLPSSLAPPTALGNHITAWTTAASGAAGTAVTVLKADSEKLGVASAYLAGYLLGKLRNREQDKDLDLKSASKLLTILGAPVYERLSQEFPGSFANGIAAGARNVSGTEASASLAATLTTIAASMATI